MNINRIVYLIALLEGFTTLAVQVLIIRKATPIIGSNLIITSVVIGIVILALSVGYYHGGAISSKFNKDTIVKILGYNLLFAGIFYVFVSFFFQNKLLEFFIDKTSNYVLSIFVAILILFFIPVYVASQTVPLLSEISKITKKGETVGKILFYSTIGSFFGSIIPILVLIPSIGLSKSVFLIGGILILCNIFLIWGYFKKLSIIGLVSLFIIVIFSFFHKEKIKNLVYYDETPHHSITIIQNGDVKLMKLDGSYSSSYDTINKESIFDYIKETILLTEKLKPQNILMIGAAGFTFPNQISKYDFVKKLVVVDIDKKLKKISEEYFLGNKLSDKIDFEVLGGRYYVNKSIKEKKYFDMIFVDVYSSRFNIPNQFLTAEFFDSLTKMGDTIICNIIVDKQLQSDFGKNLFTTMEKSRGKLYYYDVKNGKTESLTNILVSNKSFDNWTYYSGNGKIYLDDQNNIEIDKFKLFYNIN